jgi:hypothetical protein
MSGRLDLRRQLRDCYSARPTPALVQVPDLAFLMVDGHGDPNSAPSYTEAVQALYATAYAVRFALKRGPDALDAPVMPLEGLWWVPDMATFSVEDKAAWDWTMMIALPDVVTAEAVEAARGAAARKVGAGPAGRVRLERYTEGLAAQILHVGPYSAEGPTVRRLHEFIAEQGHRLAGKHHEIYLSDPRRGAPDRLRTIVRQPVASRS